MCYGTAVRDRKYFLQVGVCTEPLAVSESVASSRGSSPTEREGSLAREHGPLTIAQKRRWRGIPL